VAEALRLPDEVGHTPTAAVIEHLAGRHPLLLLDNCEHLIGACAELAEGLLQACPGLRVLATSREALQLPGEVVWRVPSLTTPAANADALPPLERLADYEAVRLFVERAAGAQPGFRLTAQNAAAVAQVCAHLDGIPLALEMAAARVGALSVAEIAARLDDRFALLTSGSRTALPRQRTLQATLEWSYQLLSGPERALLARLSVFADGCTADAAQEVCADAGIAARTVAGTAPPLPLGGLGPADVLPLLLELVHKSLVTADTRSSVGPAERTRFRLYEMVRQFAAEKLDELGEADFARERLAAYLMALGRAVETPEAARYGTDRLSGLEAELGNVHALMAWARARPDGGEIALRLITALTDLWEQRGHLAEPLSGLEEALARGDALPPVLRAEALTALLRFLAWRGYNLTRWAARAEELLVLLEQVDDPTVKNEALFWAGSAALHRSDFEAAQASFERRLHRSDFEAAQASFERRLHLPQPLDNVNRVCTSLLGLGMALLMQGDGAGAATFFRRDLAFARENKLGDHIFLALNLLDLVDHRAALAQCEREVTQQRELANPEDLGQVLQVYAQSLLIECDYARARAVLDECLTLWRDLGVQYRFGRGTAQVLLDLGQVAALQGDVTAARTFCEQSLDLYRHIGDLHHTARLHLLLGHVLLRQGDPSGAAAAITRGLNLYRELGQPGGLAQALLALGALAEARGRALAAARLCAAAAAVPSRMLLSIMPLSLTPADFAVYERAVAAARSRFNDPSSAAAWEEGAEMSLDQAVDYAYKQLTED
jgi:predicted ATPase